MAEIRNKFEYQIPHWITIFVVYSLEVIDIKHYQAQGLTRAFGSIDHFHEVLAQKFRVGSAADRSLRRMISTTTSLSSGSVCKAIFLVI